MHFFEIVEPGTWIDFGDLNPRERGDMENMLSSLKNLFTEATLALNLFEQSINVPDPEPTLAQYDRRMRRLGELEQLVEDERGPSTDFFRSDIKLEAEARLKREERAEGKLPLEFEHRICYVYAKAFLFSLAGFARHLEKMVAIPGSPVGMSDICKKMVDAFPDLREVRNSAEHIEDRVRSLGNYNRPLELKPITNGMVPPELKALILDELNGSTYRTTMVGGNLGEVDITRESMVTVQGILQEVLDAFVWKGPPVHLPGYGRLS